MQESHVSVYIVKLVQKRKLFVYINRDECKMRIKCLDYQKLVQKRDFWLQSEKRSAKKSYNGIHCEISAKMRITRLDYQE